MEELAWFVASKREIGKKFVVCFPREEFLRTGSLVSASMLASAEGSVAELALVFAFWCESRLPRGRGRGRWGRENCDACAGHLEGRVACVVFDVVVMAMGI